MSDELWRMSAVEAVSRLRKGEISPLELVEASARRIGEVEPAVNALPTLCLERARGGEPAEIDALLAVDSRLLPRGQQGEEEMRVEADLDLFRRDPA